MQIDGDAFFGIICKERPGGMWLMQGKPGALYDFPILGWRYLRVGTVRHRG